MSATPGDPRNGLEPKVFITYRRQETGPHAGRLYDAMVSRFGEGNVFMDVDMAPGVDFVQRITEAVLACHVLIVVMGPRWATVDDKHGRPRLADPEDFVRLEVETALRRPEVTPIPVLVGGAQMPNREDLPEEVRAITRRNALELSDQRWRQDVGRLISTLDELLVESPVPGAPSGERGAETEKAAPADAAQPGETAPPSTVSTATPVQAKPAAPWTRLGRRMRWALLGTLAIAAIVIAIVVAAGGGGSSSSPTAAGGGGSSSPPTHFTAADPPKLVLPSSDPPASNLIWKGPKSGGGQKILMGAAKQLNVPPEKLQAAYNNHWDAVNAGQQPQAADSAALVFNSNTGAENGFANLQGDLAGGQRIDWNPGGDSFAVLRNASTAPEYTYIWRTGNLLQIFDLSSSSPDTPVTQNTASSAADSMRCLIPRQCG